MATALSLAPGYTYYHEPDNFDAVPEANERFFWLYLTPEEREPAYLSLMARACAGRVTTAHTMWHDPGPLLQPFGERGRRLGEVTLQIPGRHYVLDALAALACGLRLGFGFPELARGLAAFSARRRRL